MSITEYMVGNHRIQRVTFNGRLVGHVLDGEPIACDGRHDEFKRLLEAKR